MLKARVAEPSIRYNHINIAQGAATQVNTPHAGAKLGGVLVGNPSADGQLISVIKPSACGFIGYGEGIDCDSGLWYTYTAGTLGDVTLLYLDY